MRIIPQYSKTNGSAIIKHDKYIIKYDKDFKSVLDDLDIILNNIMKNIGIKDTASPLTIAKCITSECLITTVYTSSKY